jgi:DNA-directed RNA polymerase specialized sigma24 family protein
MTASVARSCTQLERSINQRALRAMMGTAAYHARRVAQTMGLGEIDREDVEHDILLALLERRRFFDPARGAWSSFADRVARQAAQSAADQIGADRRIRAGSLDQPLGDDPDATTLQAVAKSQLSSGVAPDEQLRLPLALTRFIAELPRELAIVANLALREDGDLPEAQRRSGLSTSEFYRRLREIRYRLLAVGLVERRPDR